MKVGTQQLQPRRLQHFTPLRYPGGKGKLASFVKALIDANGLHDGLYVEPYAGGAGIALELLLQEYVSQIHINDVSYLIYSFWWSVLNETEALCRLIVDTPRTVNAWDKQKLTLMNPMQHSKLAVGFATFFLNRTNRSDILNGGVIGGRNQTGPWRIDARYNAHELVARVEAIARLGPRITLSQQDAAQMLIKGASVWPEKCLIYLDPPYYGKGRDLYYGFYRHNDHAAMASLVQENLIKQHWIVSYDNEEAICTMYAGRRRAAYSIGYSAREIKKGSEVMFFSDRVEVPPLIGPLIVAESPKQARALPCTNAHSSGPA